MPSVSLPFLIIFVIINFVFIILSLRYIRISNRRSSLIIKLQTENSQLLKEKTELIHKNYELKLKLSTPPKYKKGERVIYYNGHEMLITEGPTPAFGSSHEIYTYSCAGMPAHSRDTWKYEVFNTKTNQQEIILEIDILKHSELIV